MTVFKGHILFLLSIFIGTVLPCHASDKAVKLSKGTDLIDRWNQDQHLFVRGNIGLPDQTLDELEKWLDQNGRNWTILLTQNSTAERHRNAFGKSLTGMSAVEDAVLNGLQARTKFGKLRDPKTGLLNGAIFILFLEERKFSYYGADHYSRNGAPLKSWIGGLDRSAKQAMRNGGRIVEAVKGTVTSIDRKVQNTLQARETTRLREAAKTRDEINKLKSQLEKVAEKHATIVSDLEGAGGDFSRFPLQDLRAQLAAMEKSPGTYNPDVLRQNLNRWEAWFDQFSVDQNELKNLEAKLEKLSPSSSQGKATLAMAREQLSLAQNAYKAGKFSYQRHLSDGRGHSVRITMLDQAARRAAQKRSRTIKIGSATGVGFAGLLAVAGNRRRRRIKSQAEELLASRKLEMKKTEDRLFELMDRSSVIVGPFDELPNRGYTGDTLELSKKALKHIDEAFVLSSNVQKIIEEGEALIEPGNPLSRTRNLISGGRYEAAVDLLDAELNVGRKIVPKLKERARPGEEVDETFSVPIDEWEDRTTTALDSAGECLDRVEKSWSTIISRSEGLGRDIDSLATRKDDVQVDEWLRCELLFEEWIPTMTEFAERAAETGKSDPVRALEGDMAEGDRMAGEAKALLDLLVEFRKEHWKNLENGEATLDKRRRDTIWIDNVLADLSRDSERIAEESPDGDVSPRIAELNSDLNALAARVADGARLIEKAEEETLPAIKSANQMVSTARREIAVTLKLKSDEILIEENANPSDFLGKANLQYEAALAALDLGEVTGGTGFINEADALTDHANQLVKETREILANYHDTSEELWKRRGDLEERGEQLRREVEAMRIRYAPRALFLDPHAPESGTFSDAPAQLDNALKGIVSRLDRAKVRFTAGGLLESWSLIEEGQSLANDGEILCGEVTSRSRLLHRMEDENAERHESQTRAEADFREPVGDRRVTRETIQLFEEIGTKLHEAGREIEAGDGRRDPYLVEEQLEGLSERIPILRSAIAEDLEQHSRALQLFETVRRNQQEAGKLWQTADSDRIPNSPKTNEAMNEIEACHGKLEDAHRDLQIDHADWREIQNNLRSIHLVLSESIIELKQELALAREAVRALEAATREVRKAARWSGSYGVRITGNYGQRSLAAANDVMQHGLYQEALSMSGQARTRARSAIAHAESREAAKRRAAQAGRRRRQQSSMNSSFGSSGFGSRSSGSSFGSSSRSSFGSSSSRSSSGMSRSSFSSGSGMSRSGW